MSQGEFHREMVRLCVDAEKDPPSPKQSGDAARALGLELRGPYVADLRDTGRMKRWEHVGVLEADVRKFVANWPVKKEKLEAKFREQVEAVRRKAERSGQYRADTIEASQRALHDSEATPDGRKLAHAVLEALGALTQTAGD